jgi:hypothetical protein
LATELAKAQVSALGDMPPPSNFGLSESAPSLVSRTGSGGLRPADHHRPAPDRREDPAETRLPLGRAPQVLRPAHRRRTDLATAKDPASNNIARGWTRLTGLTPLMLWLTCLLAVRNQRILTAWNARQADDARRAAAGLPPKTRRRRRKTPTDLATAGTPP